MKHDAERLILELSEQDRIQHQIRAFISSFRTTNPGPRRKGAAYASHAVTSGWRLFKNARRFGFNNTDLFKTDAPARYRRLVMVPNIIAGRRLGSLIRDYGYPITIVPGEFYVQGWTQVHYMAAWRPVIIFQVTVVVHEVKDLGSTFGGTEEFKIAILSGKRIFFVEKGDHIIPADLRVGADIIRRAVDRIARMGFDPKLIYEQWQEIDLLVDHVRQKKRRSVNFKTA